MALLDGAAPPPAPQLALPFAGWADDDGEPELELSAPALGNRAQELDLLRSLHGLAAACSSESKVDALLRLLRRIPEPAIVFTQYRDTLQALAAALGPDLPQLHGGLSLRERQAAARRFTHGDAPLLLATDAASEGLNLHQRCRLVVNLELPWTPLRLEQRVGRVDRLGQERRVHAVHLVAADTEEEDIAAGLRDRSQRVEDALGDPCNRLDDTANAECTRIELARRLASGAAANLPARPVVAHRRRRSTIGPSSISAYRLPLVDAAGVTWWDWVIGWPTRESPASEGLCQAGVLAAAQREIAAAATARARRVKAIAADVRAQHARLSAALLQRGLFDRRNERAASAQARILASVLAATDAHRAGLTRMASLTPGPPHLLFALIRR
jgi:hypothetical protein